MSLGNPLQITSSYHLLGPPGPVLFSGKSIVDGMASVVLTGPMGYREPVYVVSLIWTLGVVVPTGTGT